jgi:hypothetical protein
VVVVRFRIASCRFRQIPLAAELSAAGSLLSGGTFQDRTRATRPGDRRPTAAARRQSSTNTPGMEGCFVLLVKRAARRDGLGGALDGDHSSLMSIEIRPGGILAKRRANS